MGFSAARLARIAPWYQGLATNVADGSKGEMTALKSDFRYTPGSGHGPSHVQKCEA
jgi:hypothetical protein